MSSQENIKIKSKRALTIGFIIIGMCLAYFWVFVPKMLSDKKINSSEQNQLFSVSVTMLVVLGVSWNLYSRIKNSN